MNQVSLKLDGFLEAREGFLTTLVQREPDWAAFGGVHAFELPGVLWKLTTIRDLEAKDPRRHRAGTPAAPVQRAQSACPIRIAGFAARVMRNEFLSPSVKYIFPLLALTHSPAVCS
jgi:hypothetical protein